MDEMENTGMTPEDLADFKRLSAMMKKQKAGLSEHKSNLFTSLCSGYVDAIKTVRKEVYTISTGKDPMADGSVYAITFGVETPEDPDAPDTKELATSIIENNQSVIEQLMGISNSIKVAGKIDDQVCFWQIRKSSKD